VVAKMKQHAVIVKGVKVALRWARQHLQEERVQ